MKKKALVLTAEADKLVIAVTGNGDSGEPLAACCVVPSQKIEVKNTLGNIVKAGDEVWMNDGLGAMVGSGLAFLLIPALLYGILSTLFGLWGGLLGVVSGLLLGYLNFHFRHLSQYPKLVSRITSADENLRW